tara:strand:- start:6175 stop:7566 length:1392 start_codon:yes stop_codon:yes gene_type:complete
MTVNDHNVTDWAARNESNIAKHWSQPLKPHNEGGLFGRSTFGFATQTLGISPNGPVGALINSNFDKDALLAAGKTWATSWIGQAVNRWLSGEGGQGTLARKYEEYLSNYNSHGKGLDHMGHTESEGHGDRFRRHAAAEADYDVNRKDQDGLTYGFWRELLEYNDADKVPWEGFKFNHKLETKGHLSFSYDNDALGGEVLTPFATDSCPDKLRYEGEEFKIFRLPFFENPKISESRQASYASHDIVNRNEPYRLWTGAKAKKVNLSFNITGPHLVTFADQIMKEQVNASIMTAEFKKYLVDTIKDQSKLPLFAPDPGDFTPSGYGVYQDTNNLLRGVTDPGGIGDTGSENNRNNLVVYTMYLINLIRSSVIGSTNNSEPEEGFSVRKTYIPAPIIFLTHGLLYNKEPFIATNYSINFDGKSGYEELSMIPRVISVKLTLEGFNQFEKSDKSRGLKRLFTPRIDT